jgi:hypothetical protein
MAYGTRYTANWVGKNKTGVITIAQKNYVGASEVLKLQYDAITITKQLDNWESHIIGDVCEFNIVNDKADYYELLDLMVAAERKYKVTVTCTYNSVSYTLFVGFINTEAVNQKLVRLNVIHLVASSFVSKLEYVYPTTFNNIVNVTFIDIVSEILQQAGSTHNIRVSSFLLSGRNTSLVTGKTFMNSNGITTEVFWENNVDRVDSYKILEQILSSFQCYLYFWDGYWYIESFDVLFNSDHFYVEYVIGQSYLPTDTGTYMDVTYTVSDLHSLVMMEMSQTLTVTPGNRTVEIRVNQQPYYNLTVNDFTFLAKVSDEQFVPPFREWRAFQPMTQTLMRWDAQGLPYKTMVNSIKRTSTYVNTPNANNIELFDYPNGGLYTAFKLTYVDGITELSIKWKYSRDIEASSTFVYAQKWVLNVFELETDKYLGDIYYDPNDKHPWRMVTRPWHMFGDPGLTNRNDLTSGDFDSKTYIAEVSINIPLSEVYCDKTSNNLLPPRNYKMILRILTDFVYVSGKQSTNFVEPLVYFGDIQISASIEAYDENVITGVNENTDFLNKMGIDVDLVDAPNYNYKNGILEGDNLEFLTSVWRRNEIVGTDRKLVDYVLIDKFRMGDVSRQSISASIKNPALLKPFTMFTDSKQNDKKFLLTNIVHDVTKDEYEIVLSEYDNTTAINLTES